MKLGELFVMQFFSLLTESIYTTMMLSQSWQQQQLSWANNWAAITLLTIDSTSHCLKDGQDWTHVGRHPRDVPAPALEFCAYQLLLQDSTMPFKAICSFKREHTELQFWVLVKPNLFVKGQPCYHHAGQGEMLEACCSTMLSCNPSSLSLPTQTLPLPDGACSTPGTDIRKPHASLRLPSKGPIFCM